MSRDRDGTIIVQASPPPAATTWAMTELDTVNALLSIRGAWVFDRELDAGRLRDGLAKMLAAYPHLAGRMHGKAVRLDNTGVPFTVSTRRAITVRDLCDQPARAHRLAGRLNPLLVQWGLQPLLKVRLTRLRNGTLLTVTCSHAALDGNGFFSFVRNWGCACTGRPFPLPVLDPSLVPAPSPGTKDEVLQLARAEGWDRVPGWTLLRIVCWTLLGRLSGRRRAAYFPPETLRRLRRTAAREAGLPTVRTFDALSAHLVRMCARLVGLPDATPCCQVTILDARRRVPALPATYAGNAAFACRTPDLPAGAPLGEIVGSIQRELDPILAVPSPRLVGLVSLARALVRHGLLVAPYDLARMHAVRPTLTYINNFSMLPVYDVDFGGEGAPVLPVRAIPHDLPDPVLIWPAPPEQGGVEVYFTGRYARALGRLEDDDPWWSELRRVEAPGRTADSIDKGTRSTAS